MSRTAPLSLVLYGMATALLEPLAPLILGLRVRRGREDEMRLGERLGLASVARPAGRVVWLHGVSVGETASLLPLIDTLRQRRPDLGLLVTSGTVTAASLLADRLAAGVIHQYGPIDTPRAVRRFLDHWRPDLGIFVESELWPNLILKSRRRGVALALISARMTAKSARGWGRFPATARVILNAFDLVAPQDAATRARLEALGAPAGPQLNLKLAGAPLPASTADLARLRASLGARKVVLAASTHPGEEVLIAEGFAKARRDPAEALLIVAPRHPSRGPEIAAALGATRRGAGEPPTGATYIADTLGELGLFFRLADVVVMGGSFVAGPGGHNPMEPARIGRAILTGPHVHNAAETYAALSAAAAAIEAKDVETLSRHLRGLLDYPAIAARMGEAALASAEAQGRAVDDAYAALEPLLPA